MTLDNIFQHFHADEHAFVEKMLDIIATVQTNYSYHLTRFLNPRQVEIVKSLTHREGLKVFVSSDVYPSEYARVLIAPDYYELVLSDFELSLIELNYNRKFNHVTHSQILGTLLNQLGLQRDRLGEVIVTDEAVQILTDKRFEDLILQQITKIGRVPVKPVSLPLSDLVEAHEVGQHLDVLVSSMRLDTVVAAAYRLSRARSTALIRSGKVKVDHRLIDNVSYILGDSCLLSVRGYGRLKLLSQNGQTRQGKYKLSLVKIGGNNGNYSTGNQR